MEYRLVKRKGRKWEVMWYERVPRGKSFKTVPKWLSTGTDDKEKAEEFFNGFVNGTTDVRGNALYNISEVLQEYTVELINRKTAMRNMQRHYSIVRMLLRHMGDIDFRTLNKRMTKEYIRSRDVKPQTASRELDVLSAALHYCKDEELIEWTPFRFENVQGVPRERFLSQEEINKLLDACESYHMKLWTLIALSTAARSGAILSLTCDRVRFDDNIIDFRDPTIEGKHKPRSTIKMPQGLRPYLVDAVNKSVSGYVVERDGKPMKNIYGEFIQTAQRAGLQGVTPHVMRHTCAVHMVKNGVPIYEVSKYLGHKSVEITQKHYAKFSPDFMERSSEVGSSLISGEKLRVIQ
jgi:integrase